MNERVNPFKKLQKPGKHVKRIVIGAAGLVIIAGLAGDWLWIQLTRFRSRNRQY